MSASSTPNLGHISRVQPAHECKHGSSSTVWYERSLGQREIRLLDFGEEIGPKGSAHVGTRASIKALLSRTKRSTKETLPVASDGFTYVSLDSMPAFEALSYHWGSDTQTHRFPFHGRDLFPAAVLFEALGAFRTRGYRGRLWADGLCINQNDSDEKSTQIPLMRDIYSRAQRTIVWLGNVLPWPVPDPIPSPDPARKKDTTATGLRRLAGFMEKSQDWSEQRFLDWCRRRLANRAQLTVLTILAHPWFRRLWIVQEAALATKLVFWTGVGTGDKKGDRDATVDWCTFESIGHHHKYNAIGQKDRVFTYATDRLITCGLYSLSIIILIRMSLDDNKDKMLAPWETLQIIGSQEVTETQDRVLGVLGLVSPQVAHDVDLTADTKGVFRALLTHVVTDNGDGLEICLAKASDFAFPSRKYDIPSWWLDIQANLPFKDTNGVWYSDSEDHHAGSREPDPDRCPTVSVQSGDKLKFEAFRVGIVNEVIGPSPRRLAAAEVPAWTSWPKHICGNACLAFVTHGGREGDGPPGLEVGDHVVAIPTLPILYVLRPAANAGHKEYFFIGLARIQGLMSGEALDLDPPLELEDCIVI